MINAFSDLSIIVSDGNTVPSVSVLGNKTYMDIGSGTVLKLSWTTPVATNNAVDYYKLYIANFDKSTGLYQPVLDTSIGNVNEFYINSTLLSAIAAPQCRLSIKLTAYSVYGTTYNSPTASVTAYVSRGCGTYTKVTAGYAQPIMKRAIAFSKLGYKILKDAEGKTLYDAEGKVLYAKMSSLQDENTGWAIMQEFSSKNSTGSWQLSDVRYEVLVDSNGEIITDSNSNPIYTL